MHALSDGSAYRGGAQATVACESSLVSQPDNEWREPYCFVRVCRKGRHTLFTPTWRELIWKGLQAAPTRSTLVMNPETKEKKLSESFKNKDKTKPRKVAHSWIGETRFTGTLLIQRQHSCQDLCEADSFHLEITDPVSRF